MVVVSRPIDPPTLSVQAEGLRSKPTALAVLLLPPFSMLSTLLAVMSSIAVSSFGFFVKRG